MKNNLIIMLTLLLLLVGFFASSTQTNTGAFSRDLSTGELSIGGINEDTYYMRSNEISLAGRLATASTSGMRALYNRYEDELSADGAGDFDEDGFVTKYDCRELERRQGVRKKYSNTRIANRFNNPQAYFDDDFKGDLDKDGLPYTITDQRICRMLAQVYDQGSYRATLNQKNDCAEVGKKTCMLGDLYTCQSLDPELHPSQQTLTWVKIQKPLNIAGIRCIGSGNTGKEARYSYYKPTTTLYSNS